jgi:hypothetical protein
LADVLPGADRLPQQLIGGLEQFPVAAGQFHSTSCQLDTVVVTPKVWAETSSALPRRATAARAEQDQALPSGCHPRLA